MHSSVKIALLLIRVTFGLFLLAWGLNKIVNPAATSGIFAKFYGIESLGAASSMIAGGLQVVLAVAIILGLFKTISYGAGLAVHGLSTISTAGHILMPLAEGSNLLFMAGLPIFGAILALFIARREDTLLSIDTMRAA
ncbi:DoxX family membrane protein [Paracoccus sp. 1_MG-2023]|uniref:DoxX family membrane protein n=1 Tax=unclassified Paracoccus (in: a-proteobacteria) TaxID=2688777 RepID=UPI001C08214F|nr:MULTISPECIES: DoxX family membrane protein [unclassified Paracoccus (in: a-proteobacteria)]MBU2958342.1 DoxX family membrane protein [Paracoccus sp. C2R09]MDO6668469.1 DoxX family membrane protein [Paracoccus sp. 1_MG-2023]